MRRTIALIFIVVFCSGSLLLRGGGNPAIYVATTGSDGNSGTLASPFLTAGKAQTVARARLASGGCPIVYFRGGTYPISSALSFGASDSGSASCTVLWNSYPGENAVWSGGVDLTGTFTLCTTADPVCNSGATGIYQSSNTSLNPFRELYVGGTHRERSRSSDNVAVSGWAQTSGGYTLSSAVPSPTGSWKNPTHIEVVIAGGFVVSAQDPGWQQIRCTISSVSGSAVTMGTPCWTLFKTWQSGTWGAASTPWWIENAYELLPACGPTADGKGCWYYDYTSKIIYYKPKTGENIATISVIAPQLTRMATFNAASYIDLGRLQYSENTFLPDDGAGNDYVSVQAGYYCTGTQPCGISCNAGNCVNFVGTTPMDAAIRLTNGSHHITFDHSLCTHNGGRCIFAEHGTQHITITATKCIDNGGGCIQNGEATDYAETNPALKTSFALQRNNLDVDGPFEYQDSGFLMNLIETDATIDHNESDANSWVPISLGYGYSIPTVEAGYSNNNALTNNKVLLPCQLMFDGAPFYIGGGAQPNLVASGNYGSNTNNTAMQGCLYLDDGTTGTSWPGNVCAPGAGVIHGWGYMWTGAVTGNTLSGNFTTTATNDFLDNGSPPNTISGTVQYTAGCSPNSGTCPLNIINNAGIQAGVTPGP